MSTAITISRPSTPREYWDARACRFAATGAGLGAVCSYGMPAFYNGYIDWLQARALEPWLAVEPGTSVLEIGCGVGRWTRRLARAGADVVGLDLSPAMVREARVRAEREGLETRCRFLVADTAEFSLARRFDLILGVTVLQHVLDAARLHASINGLAAHLASFGRIVLLEAAPAHPTRRCDSRVFVARSEEIYRDAFDAAGLRCLAVRAVDPAPFKTWYLPWYRRLPRPLALGGLVAATVAALPIDLLAARWTAWTSWHKVFVLGSDEGRGRR